MIKHDDQATILAERNKAEVDSVTLTFRFVQTDRNCAVFFEHGGDDQITYGKDMFHALRNLMDYEIGKAILSEYEDDEPC